MAMAQWIGQFSGNTHRSKVLDREGQLRHAIEVYRRMQPHDDRTAQGQTVKRLADQLLAARIRAMKATLNAMGPMSPDSPITNSMKTKIQNVTIAGVHAILEEFGAKDILTD
jgi:hypothetical protein